MLLVGLGGIGAPAAMVLSRSQLRGTLRICDDDVVDVLNLHRQILFGHADVGRAKVDVADRLARDGLAIDARRQRATPETIAALLRGVDVVIDGSDNFATKFLVADAARLAGIPAVIAAAVEWRGTVFSAHAQTGACYRCLFEDLPAEPGPACADVGVMGPLVGLVGVLAADAALRLASGGAGAEIVAVAADGSVRQHAIARRPDCPLCGERPIVTNLERAHYTYGLTGRRPS